MTGSPPKAGITGATTRAPPRRGGALPPARPSGDLEPQGVAARHSPMGRSRASTGVPERVRASVTTVVATRTPRSRRCSGSAPPISPSATGRSSTGPPDPNGNDRVCTSSQIGLILRLPPVGRCSWFVYDSRRVSASAHKLRRGGRGGPRPGRRPRSRRPEPRMSERYCTHCGLVLYERVSGPEPPERCPRCAKHGRDVRLIVTQPRPTVRLGTRPATDPRTARKR